MSVSVTQVLCQCGDLACDCSVIYFLDKHGSVASRVKPVTALNVSWTCLLCWDIHTSDVIVSF